MIGSGRFGDRHAEQGQVRAGVGPDDGGVHRERVRLGAVDDDLDPADPRVGCSAGGLTTWALVMMCPSRVPRNPEPLAVAWPRGPARVTRMYTVAFLTRSTNSSGSRPGGRASAGWTSAALTTASDPAGGSGSRWFDLRTTTRTTATTAARRRPAPTKMGTTSPTPPDRRGGRSQSASSGSGRSSSQRGQRSGRPRGPGRDRTRARHPGQRMRSAGMASLGAEVSRTILNRRPGGHKPSPVTSGQREAGGCYGWASDLGRGG